MAFRFIALNYGFVQFEINKYCDHANILYRGDLDSMAQGGPVSVLAGLDPAAYDLTV
jgi:hypothetical protein